MLSGEVVLLLNMEVGLLVADAKSKGINAISLEATGTKYSCKEAVYFFKM